MVAVILYIAIASLKSYGSINDRIMKVKLDSKPALIYIIQVYASTSKILVEELETFYIVLQTFKNSDRKICTFMGDFNAKVG